MKANTRLSRWGGRNACIIRTILLTAIALSKPCLHSEDAVIEKTTKTFAEATPLPIYRLAEWKTADVSAPTNTLPDGDPSTKRATLRFWDWARTVVAVDWLPAENLEVICSKEEFEKRDVIRASWVKNGRTVEISQTATIFLVKLTPTNGPTRKLSQQEMLKQMRELALTFFSKTGTRHTSQGEATTVAGVNLIIADDSLNEKRMRQFEKEDILLGVPAAVMNHKLSAESDIWFRQVHCWTDGRCVGFYFQKRPFDSLIVPQGVYSAGPDQNWFEK